MTGFTIRVRGQVQGVGFRPFVWRLAQQMGLRGEVLNDPEGVLIRATGGDGNELARMIRREAPPLARIDVIEVADCFIMTEPQGFIIAPSEGEGAETRVTPDAATCGDCRTEICDPSDRRHGYAFANCTHCGPRFSIVRGLPYDRGRTTMASFPMCKACQTEYDDPSDRRFHAQPVACADCGPQVWMEHDGTRTDGPNAIADAVRLLSGGAILAIKGLGGYHLACDARDANAIDRLRQRKHRPGKPLALMASIETIGLHATPNDEEIALLSDPAAPVVLLTKAGKPLPEAIAPGQNMLGWMLPYTPLHHLLLNAFPGPLIMTSGNLSGEPQVIENAEADAKLGGLADAFLKHDRDIARRLDDGVERITPFGPMVLRRARGRAPETLPLPPGFDDTPQIVAFGGQMKSAICLIKSGQALLSHHLGTLDDALTWQAFLQAETDYCALFDHRPQAIACDLHPGYRATQYAQTKALPVIGVQHHHAHLAACLGENLWPRDGGKVAGIVLDGLGLGPDGTIWGGELLLGDYHGFDRRAWVKPAPLIGGDRAQIDPWRNALVRLDAAGLSEWASQLFANHPLEAARQSVSHGINAPLSSSAGRLFDAVAACIGICPTRQSFEGEAAMRLEAIAEPLTGHVIQFDNQGPVIDPAPFFHTIRQEIAAGTPAASISGMFHKSLAAAFVSRARALIDSGEAKAVALSGGCFQNVVLLNQVITQLGDIPVLIHKKTPCNDGSLALGQALVAACSAECGK